MHITTKIVIYPTKAKPSAVSQFSKNQLVFPIFTRDFPKNPEYIYLSEAWKIFFSMP